MTRTTRLVSYTAVQDTYQENEQWERQAEIYGTIGNLEFVILVSLEPTHSKNKKSSLVQISCIT